jgi:phage shock protein PspC (stress-responsive transcriptional regulator)
MSLADELGKLSELRATGGLSEEEFQRAKQRLLHPERPQSEDPLVAAVNTFRRSRTDRWLGGVCGGLGRATGVASWVWRLMFALLFICAFAGLLIYLLLWMFVPGD